MQISILNFNVRISLFVNKKKTAGNTNLTLEFLNRKKLENEVLKREINLVHKSLRNDQG